MKYRLGSTTIDTIDTYVRITLGNGERYITDNQCPESTEVAALLRIIQGYPPNRAQLQACGRAADDARNNKIELAL